VIFLNAEINNIVLSFFYVRKGCTGTGVGVEGFVSLSQVLF